MSDPRLPLHRVIVAALKSGVPAVSSRVHDRAPDGVAFPYITIGEIQAVSEGADCVDGFEVTVTIHVWSRAVGSIECSTVAAAVRAALHDVVPDLSSDGFSCLLFEHRSTSTMRDPDGRTTHGVVVFRALVDALAA